MNARPPQCREDVGGDHQSTGASQVQPFPVAPTALAAPGPLVVNATPRAPAARRIPVGLVDRGLLVAHTEEFLRGVAQTEQRARLCTPGSPKARRTPSASRASTMRSETVAALDTGKRLIASTKRRRRSTSPRERARPSAPASRPGRRPSARAPGSVSSGYDATLRAYRATKAGHGP